MVRAIALGIIQGITEFLPVSSSGHLVLASEMFGIGTVGLSFSIWVHLGTGMATVVMLGKEISWLVKGIFAPSAPGQRKRALTVTAYLILASVPAALVGMFAQEQIDSAFSSLVVASLGLILTGFVLWVAGGKGKDNTHSCSQPLASVGLKRSFLVGMFQALAIIPGISRSGVTITSGLFSGMSREDAARFSFLLSLPAVFGATLLDIRSAMESQVPVVTTEALVGAVSSFIVGLAALAVLFSVVRKGNLSKFSYYCWAVGGLSLLVSLLR